MNIIDWKEKFKENKCCAMCGYKRYPNILHFHHIVQRKRRKYRKKSWYRKADKRKPYIPVAQIKNILQLKKEIKKCVLLCPNCHAIHHRKGITKTFQL